MPSLWRKVVQSKSVPEARTTTTGSPQPSQEIYQHQDLTDSCEIRLNHVKCGQGMQLLRQVHLVDPLQSPSWSGVQRGRQDHPSVLHMIQREICKCSDASDMLQSGSINLTGDANILSVRGLLLDNIKHIGPVTEQRTVNPQSYKPPKWLTKLVVTKNSVAIRGVSLANTANPSNGSLKLKESPQDALQEKYDDFMATIFAIVKGQRQSSQPQKPKDLFADISMCVTDTGYFGLVPPSTQPGDKIFMVERDPLKSVFVVRKHPVHGFFVWNGLVYIHSMAQVVRNEYATDRILIG